MKRETIINISQKIISLSFLLLFFLVPLIFTPYNYELFEYNKMMLTYGLTIIIVSFFLIKSIALGKIEIGRTPFDVPLLLFLLSQVVATIFSIDKHVSLFGYYSRFHGGLFSTTAYIALFYVLVSQFKNSPKFVLKCLKTSLVSGVLIALYAILQRLGIDKSIWVQDVQNRVFSTLGQPNWLAAYFSILILISLAFAFSEKSFKKVVFFIIALVFYTVNIFTKSRSGYVGFWGGFWVFALLTSPLLSYLALSFILEIFSSIIFLKRINLLPSFGEIINKFLYTVTLGNIPFHGFFLYKNLKRIKKWPPAGGLSSKSRKLLLSLIFFIFLSFIFGTPFSQFELFTLSRVRQKLWQANSSSPIVSIPTTSTLEFGGTESGTIRKIVWQGAIEIVKHHPLIGCGVETFAFSYYQFRPQAHNLTSEWDFLYNKAHNEYLNFAATTGIFGLSTYLLFIGSYLIWTIKKAFKDSKQRFILAGLIGSFVSILISNFFGFSVVMIGIFFFLIPAFSVVIASGDSQTKNLEISLFKSETKTVSNTQKVIISILLFVICYLLFALIQMWRADKYYNLGHQLSRANQYLSAYNFFKKAVQLNPGEPFFKDELSYTAAVLTIASSNQKEVELASKLKNEALDLSSQLVSSSPKNVNFWKTRTRVFYTLSELDPDFLGSALSALLKAWELSPNDAKIAYNIGLLYAKIGETDKAVETLKKGSLLKPDYYEPHFALALFYEQLGEKEKAIEELNFILNNIRPDDQQTKEKLKELLK